MERAYMKIPLPALLVASSMVITFTAPAKSCEQSDLVYLLRSFNVDRWECVLLDNGTVLGCGRHASEYNTTLAYLLPLGEVGRVEANDFSVTFECEIGACFKRLAFTGKNPVPKAVYLNEWIPSAMFATSAMSDLIKDQMVKCFANGGFGESE
jgi:hypothetical protein